MAVEFVRLAGAVPLGYSEMVPPELGSALVGLTNAGANVAVGLSVGGWPAGLILVHDEGALEETNLPRTTKEEHAARVGWIYVAPSYRGKGFGAELLRSVEAVLIERGVSRVRVEFSTESPEGRAMEGVLRQAGWPGSRRQLLLVQLEPRVFAEMAWMSAWVVPPPFIVFPWVELTGDEAASLEAIRETIPTALWPFDANAPINAATSVGLRHEGEVVGWVATHQVAPDVVRYTAMYVRERWWSSRLIFGLLAEACRRHIATYGLTVRGTLAVVDENAPMLRVLERRFRPFARHWHEQREAVRILRAAPGSAT